MKFVEYPDADMMMMDLANTLAGDLNSALMTHDRASFAVPGGSTPCPIFDVLSAIHLDWDRVDILLTDERWVPGDHSRSNTRMLYERLLIDNAARANYLSLYTGDPSPEEGATALIDQVDQIRPVSVLLLGMGADMHCASLFPGSDNLAGALDDRAPAVMAMHGGGIPEPRVTLTAPVLKGALSKHLVITGPEKRQALDRAVHLADPLQAPISAVLPGMTVHWAER